MHAKIYYGLFAALVGWLAIVAVLIMSGNIGQRLEIASSRITMAKKIVAQCDAGEALRDVETEKVRLARCAYNRALASHFYIFDAFVDLGDELAAGFFVTASSLVSNILFQTLVLGAVACAAAYHGLIRMPKQAKANACDTANKIKVV